MPGVAAVCQGGIVWMPEVAGIGHPADTLTAAQLQSILAQLPLGTEASLLCLKEFLRLALEGAGKLSATTYSCVSSHQAMT